MNGHLSGTPPLPELDAILERRAKRLGITVSELLEEDRKQLRAIAARDIACLDPHEVEQFFRLELTDDRLAHVESCGMCRALLNVARPNEQLLEQFIEGYVPFLEPAQPARTRSLWRLVGAVASVELPIFALAVGIVVCLDGVAQYQDTILATLVDIAALPWLGAVILSGLVAACVPIALYFLINSADARIVAGCGFAGLLAILMAKSAWDITSNYSALRIAQETLIAQIVDRQSKGSVIANILWASQPLEVNALLYSGLSGGKPGAQRGQLVAKKTAGSVDIYLDAGDSKNLGKVYEGTLQKMPDGETKVVADSKSFEVRPGTQIPSAISGQAVIALVPANDDRVSKVISVEPAKFAR